MDTSHLGEDIVADDGLIGGNGNTTIALYEVRYVFVLAWN